MQDELTTNDPLFLVVTNDEGRHALWPASRSVPRGWQPVFGTASRARCLQYLNSAKSEDDSTSDAGRAKKIQLSLMFFGDYEDDLNTNKYDLVLQSAKYADQHGLAAVWLPERHFTRFGYLFPSPAVLHAALARETTNIRLRAGSVVMPLDDPIRVAERWAMVDNLSGGRVGLSFASGWHPDDFALRPDAYEDRYERMYQGIEQVRRLWRGEPIRSTSGTGDPIDVRIYPTPIQTELPVWITAASKLETFVRAGQLGINVLTHLFDQQTDDLAEKIRLYRRTRREHGWNPDDGHVTVALHSFVAPTISDVREHAEQPYCNYLKTNFQLLKSLAISRGIDLDLTNIAGQQLDDLLKYVFEKFLGDRSLLGTPDTCYTVIGQLAEIGVNEVACLVDFGPSIETVLTHLPHLAALVERIDASAWVY